MGGGLRLIVLLIAGVAIYLTYFSWNFGMPPTWTVFMPAETVTVTRSEMTSGRLSNGTMRYVAEIEVAWPTEADRTPLGGDMSSYRRAEIADILDAYPAGQRVGIRVYEGAPYMTEIGWFRLLHALFLTVFAMVTTPIALLVAWALK